MFGVLLKELFFQKLLIKKIVVLKINICLIIFLITESYKIKKLKYFDEI